MVYGLLRPMATRGQLLEDRARRTTIKLKLSRPNPTSKCTVAREYNVDEKAVRKIWNSRASIEECCSTMSVAEREATHRASVGRFSEDRLPRDSK